MKKKILLISLVSLGFMGCQRVPITNRRQMNLMPETQLITMSVTEYQNFLAQHPALPTTDTRVQIVKSVGDKVKNAIVSFMTEKGLANRLNGYQWEFNVVNDATINAWCMPGGKVVVYTGLLPVTQDEASLAVVMGHEIAHAIARHGNERMSQGMAVQLGGQTLSILTQTKSQQTHDLFMQSFGLGSQLGMLSYSRKNELEADKLGLVFMAMAGYDPQSAIGFWKRMEASGGQKPPELLSTHPSDAHRVSELEKFMPEALKYYKKP